MTTRLVAQCGLGLADAFYDVKQLYGQDGQIIFVPRPKGESNESDFRGLLSLRNRCYKILLFDDLIFRDPARLNFGDCFAYALAKDRSAPLLFKGQDFSQTDIAVAPY